MQHAAVKKIFLFAILLPSIFVYLAGGIVLQVLWGNLSPTSDEQLFLFIWWSIGWLPIMFTVTCVNLLVFFLFHRRLLGQTGSTSAH
jgi:hypothetical protein